MRNLLEDTMNHDVLGSANIDTNTFGTVVVLVVVVVVVVVVSSSSSSSSNSSSSSIDMRGGH